MWINLHHESSHDFNIPNGKIQPSLWDWFLLVDTLVSCPLFHDHFWPSLVFWTCGENWGECRIWSSKWVIFIDLWSCSLLVDIMPVHNIVHIHNNVMWDWQYFMKYFPHSYWIMLCDLTLTCILFDLTTHACSTIMEPEVISELYYPCDSLSKIKWLTSKVKLFGNSFLNRIKVQTVAYHE